MTADEIMEHHDFKFHEKLNKEKDEDGETSID